MNDILPEEMPYWTFLEDCIRTVVTRYGYREIRFPIIEQTALFKRTIGEATDIVEKEMYTFNDRNGDSLTLRPEGTAGCVRACIEHGLLHNQIQRLWYFGPMFRHERPQKGRYRQFYQIGVEAYGMSDPEIDAELILMGQRLWKMLGLSEYVELQINTLGTRNARLAYRQKLTDYLRHHFDVLDEDSQRRLTTNPLRILDSKNPAMQTIIAKAPKLIDELDQPSQLYFEKLCALLTNAKVHYVINPMLVRGLDYYGHTVFEWVTNKLGAQGTICAGGRYDDLIQQLGGPPTPAIGFAAGLERLVLLLQTTRQCVAAPHIYAMFDGEAAAKVGLKMIEHLRDALPNVVIESHLAGGSFKSQFKRADKSGATWAIIIGADEVKDNLVSLKNLRQDMPQRRLGIEDLILYFEENKTW
jgi:histidyl-tRNA synthetase